MRLFFSYSRSDQELVFRLRQDLERAGHELWIDQDDIPGGTAWRRSIGEGIAGADLVLIVVTPASMASPNVERELTVADEQAKRLLPLLAQPAVIPPGLSFLLAGVQHVDFTTRRYPDALAELHEALAAFDAASRGSGLPAGGQSTGGGPGGARQPSAGYGTAGHGQRARSKAAWQRGPSRTQLAVALAVVAVVAAFLGGIVVSGRNDDPLAIGDFLGEQGCDGVVVVTGVMPKESQAKGLVEERMEDTAAALAAAGLRSVPVRYLDGDKSCFAAPQSWMVIAGPFEQVNQAAAVCSAIRDQGEFAADPSITLSLRTASDSRRCA
jgi:hypothetical protein